MGVKIDSIATAPYPTRFPERTLMDREAQVANPLSIQHDLDLRGGLDVDDGTYGPSFASVASRVEINARIAVASAQLPESQYAPTEEMIDRAARSGFEPANLMIKLTVAMADALQNRLDKEVDPNERSHLVDRQKDNFRLFEGWKAVIESTYQIEGQLPRIGDNSRFDSAEYSIYYKGEALGGWKW